LPPWLQTGILPDLPDLPDLPQSADVTLPPRPRRKMTDWLNSVKAEGANPPPASSGSASPPAEEAPPPPSFPTSPAAPEPDLPEWLQKLRVSPSDTQPGAGAGANPSLGTGIGSAGLGGRSRQQEMPEH